MLRTLYLTTYTKVRLTVNEMPLTLLRIPTLNIQLMKCFILYILLRIPRLDKQLMKCFVLYILLRIPSLGKLLMKCFVFYILLHLFNQGIRSKI